MELKGLISRSVTIKDNNYFKKFQISFYLVQIQRMIIHTVHVCVYDVGCSVDVLASQSGYCVRNLVFQ